jgi:nitrite reductase (NADH) large subunit
MAGDIASTGGGSAAVRDDPALGSAPVRDSAHPGSGRRSTRPQLSLRRAARQEADARKVLVVVGNGMVSQRFCQRCVELGLAQSHRIVVFGEEALPAYDRVRLSDVLTGEDLSSLILEPMLWYADHDIDLRLSERVVAVDRERRALTTQLGDELAYDQLVFATGSRVSVPSIVGTQHPGVYAYRSAEDVKRIRARATAVAGQRGRAVVIGSGLLGIEAGQALKALGCEVTFVEAARHLLSRQLDSAAAGIVANLLLEAGFDLCVGQSVQCITLLSQTHRPHLVSVQAAAAVEPDTLMRVEFEATSLCEAIECGMVVLASGVQPRDELARQAGIACAPPGGIHVDEGLATNDPHVFAIGECARFEEQCHGLVAPGYAMAEVLAERLAGKASRFTNLRPSTRLAVANRQIVVLGDNRDSGPGVEELSARGLDAGTSSDDDSYRRLVLRDGRIVGATAIGEWSDLPLLESAIVARTELRRRERRRFARGLPLWREGVRPSLEQWPDTATVCACLGVSCGALRRARADGHRTVEQLCERTRAGSGCGSCLPLVATFTGTPSSLPPLRLQLGLALLSLSVLGGLIWAVQHGPLALDSSVRSSFSLDLLWRNPLARQISGYALAALCAATGLVFALRRRVRRLRSSDFASSRTLHVLLGAFTLLATGVHTGMRSGQGLDAALLASLVLMMAVGATTAILLASGRLHGPQGQQVRRWGMRVHVWIAWPMPVLLLLHVLKAYYF